MREQHKTKASERIGKAGRPKVLFIEIPSDSRFRLWAGPNLLSIIDCPETFTSFRGGREFVALAWILRQNLGFCNMFGEVAALDRKSTRLNSSHIPLSRMPSSA